MQDVFTSVNTKREISKLNSHNLVITPSAKNDFLEKKQSGLDTKHDTNRNIKKAIQPLNIAEASKAALMRLLL